MIIDLQAGDRIKFSFVAVAGDQPLDPEYTRFEIGVFEINGQTLQLPRYMEISLHTEIMHNGALYVGKEDVRGEDVSREVPDSRPNTTEFWECRLEQETAVPLVSMGSLANTKEVIPQPLRPFLKAMREPNYCAKHAA